MEFEPIVGLAIFAGAFGINYLGSLGIRRTAEGKALSAASLDAGITAINALVVITFVNHPIYVLPEILGCFAGSYWAIRLDNRKKPPCGGSS